MKITKYIHSCLLVEENNKTILIDPGSFSYEANVLDIAVMQRLDYVLITHEHADHCYLPFIKELLAKFPAAKIMSNQEVAALLAKENIAVQTRGDDAIEMESVKHERIFDTAPANTKFDIFATLTHPGDSLHFSSTKKILALPITAPWGSTEWAYETAIKLKPKVIIPIHDWLWRDEIRQGMSKRLQKMLSAYGIDFKSIESGETIEVE